MEYEKALGYNLDKYNLNWKRYLLLIAVVLLFFITVGFVFKILAMRFVESVSIATHPSQVGLGDLVFIETTSLFPLIYLAIDLTPGNDGDEFIVAFLDSSDSYSFKGAVKSNDGTVVAIRTTVGDLALPEEKGGGFYPFTHAYDFKTQTMISSSDTVYSNSDGSEAVWDDTAEKIFNLLQERGGPVPFIKNRGELGFKRLSYSESQRWREMISEFNESE